jgi:hypothetical protein
MFLLCVVLIVGSVAGCVASTDSSQTGATAANPAPLTPATPLEEVGIPLFPGSTKVALEVSAPAANGSKRVTAEYSSTEPFDKVAKFYEEKLGLMVGQVPGAKLNQLVGKTSTGAFVQILVGPNGPNSKIQYYFVLPPKT